MEAVRKIGEIQLKDMQQKGEGLLEGFTEDISGGGNYNNALEIIIEKNNSSFKYLGINLKQYEASDKSKYLYRSGSSRGTDVTPSAKVTDIEKTFSNKIIKAFPEAIKFGENKYKEEIEILKEIYSVMTKEENKILEDLKEKIKTIPKKEGSFITVCLQINDKKLYVGDFEVFKNKIVSDALKKFHYSEAYKKDVYKDKATCSLCLKVSNEIYGLAGSNIFPFYTIDKPGYIAGGFNYEKAWRNYPVCKNCAIELEQGKRYLDNNLTFSFYGRRYYLIPKPIFDENLDKVLKKYLTLKSENISDVREKYSYTEERVMKLLSKEENSISFDLMFFEKNNAALNILLNIEDVAPSRFRTIFNSIDKIRDMEFFKEQPVSFEILNKVFPKTTHNKYFLEIIDKIISNRKLEYKFLMPFFNEYIINSFSRYESDQIIKGEDTYKYAVFRVFSFLYFLEFLDLFKHREEDINMSIEHKIWDINDFNSKRELFEAFFNEANPFFDIPDKKVVFLVGYITKKLLNIQYINEKRKPFISRLKGLKLSRKDIKRLIPELQSKLIEYKSEYYNEEFNIISEYLIQSNGLDSLSDLDIPMYFSLGMNMDKNFRTSVIDEISLDEK
ncbi:CRISPR-associated protein, Csh1 family [Clostridium sp. USBA 49]|uniref:TIGR02556 family CRISPR-associated protein n=1 Tax=Clostridium sp. USBA 49 TaxID=1881060 RepID=UPI0009CC3B44|nr:TIGR02556 family CRISPR-associated protein [Clostridium sp. USBA 49]SKA90386.1 CRISPR-associated protein, Csh1 family [Clostridium sp. USBA 49]